MTEPLPILIKASDELVEQFTKLRSLSNKLEAQFNFQTLTAGWYGDEDNILLINLYLELTTTFTQLKQQHHMQRQTNVADDVFSFEDKELNQLHCFIAITDSELTILQQQEKLLSAYIQAKLQKVLNVVAEQQGLTAI